MRAARLCGVIEGQRSRADIGAILFLVALTTLVLADTLLSGRCYVFRDVAQYYFPTKKILHDAILRGELPYWNRFYSAGQPAAANPDYAVFYPPQWLTLLPDYYLGFRLHIAVHFYIAAIGMYLMLRNARLTIAASLFGALTFMLSGWFWSLNNLLPCFFAVAWIPWIMYGLGRAFDRPSARTFALPALALGVQALIGEPFTLAQTWILAIGYTLYRAWLRAPDRREMVKFTLTASSIFVVSLLIGAVQLVPAADFARDTVRSAGFDFQNAMAWSLPPLRLPELLWPHLTGHWADLGESYWGDHFYPKMIAPFLLSIYSGLLVLPLACAAVVRRVRCALPLAALFGVMTILAFGRFTPLFDFLQHVQIGLRSPEKFAILALFALVVIASLGADAMLRDDERVRKITIVCAAIIAAAAIAAALFSLTPSFSPLFRATWQIPIGVRPNVLEQLASFDFMSAAAKSLVMLFLLFLLRSRKRFALVLFVLFVVIDLVPVARDISPTEGPRYFSEPEIAQKLAPAVEGFRFFPEFSWTSDRDSDVRTLPRAMRHWAFRSALVPFSNGSWGIPSVYDADIDVTWQLRTDRLFRAMWKARGRGVSPGVFMAMGNARFRSVFRRQVAHAEDPMRVSPTIVIGQPTLPRYYFSDQLVTMRDDDDFVEKLSTARYSPRVAFIESPSFSPAPARVLRYDETSSAARIDVEATGRSFLVMSVTPHRYWRAFVDGQPAALQPVNIGYQGAEIPAGRHVVTMQHRNPLIPPLIALALLTTLALIAAIILSPREPRASSPAF